MAPVHFDPKLLASGKNEVISTAAAMIAIETTFTLLRALARHHQASSWMWADILVPAGLVFNLAVCILSIVSFSFISPSDPYLRPTFTQITLLYVPCCYYIASALPKLAILDLYIRIFTQRWAKWLSYAIGVIIILNTIVNIPTTIWQCDPIAFTWDKTLNGTCNDIATHAQYANLPNIITDVAMLLMPLPILWKLHVETKVKVGVFFTFLIGSVGLITAVLRFVDFAIWKRDGAPSSGSVLPVRVILEPGMYLIAACLLTFKTLLKYILTETPISTLFSRSTWTNRHSNSQRLGSMDHRENATSCSSQDQKGIDLERMKTSHG